MTLQGVVRLVEDGTSRSRWLLWSTGAEHRRQEESFPLKVKFDFHWMANTLNLSTPQSKSVMVEYGIGARFDFPLFVVFSLLGDGGISWLLWTPNKVAGTVMVTVACYTFSASIWIAVSRFQYHVF